MCYFHFASSPIKRDHHVKRLTLLITALLIASLSLGVTGTANATLIPPKRSEVIATGPGYVLVGSGVRITDPTTIPAGWGTIRCGWTSCSLYLTRKVTKNLNSNMTAATGVYGAGAVFCALPALASGPGAPIIGASCGAFWAAQGGFIFNATSRAAKKKGCLQIRLNFPVGYTFHAAKKTNPYCHKK